MPDPRPALVDIVAAAIYADQHGDSPLSLSWDDAIAASRSDRHDAGLHGMGIGSARRAARAALAAMPVRTPQDATYGTNTTPPTRECPPATTAPQNGVQGRNEWADGYAAAKRYYGDTAPLALDKIRDILGHWTGAYGWAGAGLVGNLISDLQAILDTAQEPDHA